MTSIYLFDLKKKINKIIDEDTICNNTRKVALFEGDEWFSHTFPVIVADENIFLNINDLYEWIWKDITQLNAYDVANNLYS